MMARRFSSSPRRGLLSPVAVAAIRRRSKQTVGLLIVAVAVVLGAMLFSYHPADLSMNTAIDMPPHNFLAFPGALLADICLQFFGAASFLILPAILVLGVHFIAESPMRLLGWRLFFLMIGFSSAVVALGACPNKTTWFVSSGLGGAFGVLAQIQLQQWVGGFFPQIISFFLGGVAFFFYGSSLGIHPRFWGRSILFIYRRLCWVMGLIPRVDVAERQHPHIHEFPENHEQNLENDQKQRDPALIKPLIFQPESFVSTLLPDMDREKQHWEAEALSEDSLLENDFQEHPSLTLKIDQDLLEEKKHLQMEDREKTASITVKMPPTEQKQHTTIPFATMDDYQLPSVDLLDQSEHKNTGRVIPPEVLQSSAQQLETVLQEFGVRGEIVLVSPGPVVTLYELKPAAGIKTSRVIGLADDIARSMSALSARIAVIPGRNVIGIELPNQIREMVYLRELLLSQAYFKTTAQLPLILGKDIGGQPIIADLARMPHSLVAGTTGSGKSVAINTMIMSILFRLPPEKCRFIMIDPKMLELSVYDGIPHLLTPVVTDPKKAVVALKWAVREMENRYRAMAKLGVRNIDGYNTRIQDARTSGELLIRRVQTGFDPDSGKPIFENQSLDVEPLPYIIVIVDEMADLMMVAGKEIEAAVQRLAQMARAAGIHLIMATQRPSVDVITGTIKANFPTRMSFQVTSKIDSRTILGEQGAEQLLGQGDMLYMAGGGRVMRVHGPFVRDDEVERVVRFLKMQGEPTYEESITQDDTEEAGFGGDDVKSTADPLYQQAVDLVRREGKVSTSFVQRYLQIGYNRAARIVEQMEKEDLVSPANSAGKREVLM